MGKRKKHPTVSKEDAKGYVVNIEPKSTTKCVPLAKHCRYGGFDGPVHRLCKMGQEDWSYIVGLGNDVALMLVTKLIAGGAKESDLPDLCDNKQWAHIFVTVYKCCRGKKLEPGGSAKNWYPWSWSVVEIIRDNFGDVLREPKAAYSTNFTDAMGTQKAANYKNFRKFKWVAGHLSQYLKGKYQISVAWMARRLAGRIMCRDPLGFTKLPPKMLEKLGGIARIRTIITDEAAIRNRFVSANGGKWTSGSVLLYRHFMLTEIEKMWAQTTGARDAIVPRGFNLIPMTACGADLYASFSKKTLAEMAPSIKDDFPEFAKAARVASNDPSTFRLGFFFGVDKLKSKRWKDMTAMRTNGFEAHFVFTRKESTRRLASEMKERGKKARKAKYGDTDDDDDMDGFGISQKDIIAGFEDEEAHRWDLAKLPRRKELEHLRAADPGRVNIYTWTDRVEREDECGVFYDTFVSKGVTYRSFASRSGRLGLQRATASSNSRRKPLLADIATHHTKTTNMEALTRALVKRHGVRTKLLKHNSSMGLKRRKFNVRQRTDREIDRIIDALTDYGAKTVAVGHGGGGHGLRGCMGSFPHAKAKKRAVQRGYDVFVVDEAYTTKSSLCCHQHKAQNREARNGMSPETYRNGRYKAFPRTVRGSLVCNNCGTTYGRDGASGVNIYEIAKALLTGEPRPERFTHRYWRDEETPCGH